MSSECQDESAAAAAAAGQLDSQTHSVASAIFPGSQHGNSGPYLCADAGEGSAEEKAYFEDHVSDVESLEREKERIEQFLTEGIESLRLKWNQVFDDVVVPGVLNRYREPLTLYDERAAEMRGLAEQYRNWVSILSRVQRAVADQALS